jgi:hypothetical protein
MYLPDTEPVRYDFSYYLPDIEPVSYDFSYYIPDIEPVRYDISYYLVVAQIVTPRNFIVNLGFASVDNEFLGVAFCSTTLSAMCYLYKVISDWFCVR